MISEIEAEAEQELKTYANKHDINELSSEEIIKLMTVKPYIIKEITKAFNITEAEFKIIKKQKGIKNIFLEDTIRDIETVLYHLDSKNKFFSNNIRKQLVDLLLSLLLTSTPRKDFYIKKISEIDFNREKVINDLIEKEIDQKWRLKKLSSVIPYMESKMMSLIKKEKDYFLNHNHNELYNYLKKEKEKGKSFKAEDLTYDILFELAIIENISDSTIGNIYNMTKSQVQYKRKKLKLENIIKTKLEIYPESIMYWGEENNQRPENLSNYEYEKMMNQIIKMNDTKENDITIENQGNTTIVINNNGMETTYHVNFSNEKFTTYSNKKANHKKIQGSYHNYKKENETKRLHGQIGEQIALETEKKRLINLGLEDLVDDVQLISQIDKEITFDGLGYDMISFNEKREKICIEVKTSYGKKEKPFFISKKELELLRGLKKEHNCKQYLVYYVLIDNDNVTIKNIDPQEIKHLKLTPVLYKVESKTTQV